MKKEKAIEEIIAEQMGVPLESVTPDKLFVEDLNADSLDLTELVMTLEESFGIEIPEADAAKLKRVQDAITYIAERKKINTT